MSLENIYYIGQTVGVIAILGSLIALILQTRHTHLQNKQSNEQSQQANELAKADLMTQSMGLALKFKLTFLERPKVRRSCTAAWWAEIG